MKEINELIQPVIEGLKVNQVDPYTGYAASGTRNVFVCIGNRVCYFANYDTSAFALKNEKAICQTIDTLKLL